MLRLGRAGKFRTRGVRMLRLGKRSDPLDHLTYDDLKEILYSLYDQEKHPMVRQPPLPRYGRELEGLDDYEVAKRMSPDMALQLLEAEAYGSHMRPAPRLGRFKRSPDSSENEIASEVSEDAERAVPIPRFGRLTDGDNKDASTDEDKEGGERAVPMPRIGRENEEEEEAALDKDKRGLAMLRLGRSMKMLRLGKRAQAEFEDPEDKRSLALLRLGKRGMRMLRLGKRDPETGDEEKRSLKLLRLGKREDSEHQIDTRALSMLRLGRSQADDKRSLKLLRLG